MSSPYRAAPDGGGAAGLNPGIVSEVVINAGLSARAGASAARLQADEFCLGARLDFTQRESEVLSLTVAGASNRTIAAEPVVGEETVKPHVRGVA